MTRLKYLDPADGQYKLLPVGPGGGGGAEEVVISAGVAPALNEELWVDTSATVPVYDWSYADNRYLSSGFRNVLRNGDMSISQRGNGPFPVGFAIDGWALSGAGGSISLTRTPAVAGEASSRAVTAVSGQSAAGDYAIFYATVEDVSTLNGKTVTLSFDAWSSSGTPKIGVEVEQIFGSGGTPSATQRFSVGATTISTTRTRYTLTFTIPSVSGASLGTNSNHHLRLNFWVSSGTTFAVRSGIGIQSGTFNFTDIQLEEGTVATRFERLPVQQQLAWCQRYLYRLGGAGGALGHAYIGTGLSQSATLIRIGIDLPVPLRGSPTISYTGTIGTNVGGAGAMASPNISSISMIFFSVNAPSKVFLDLVVPAISLSYATFAYITNSIASYMDFSAEL